MPRCGVLGSWDRGGKGSFGLGAGTSWVQIAWKGQSREKVTGLWGRLLCINLSLFTSEVQLETGVSEPIRF